MGRPLEFDPDQALDAAMRLFWRGGYEMTSTQDLLDALGLSKSSLYQTFGSKRQMFERCLLHYQETLAQEMRAALVQATSGKSFLRNLVLSVTEDVAGETGMQGCMLLNTATEFAQREPEIAAAVTRGLDTLTAIIEEAVRQGFADGSMRCSGDPGDIARYLMTGMAGLKTLIKGGMRQQEVSVVADMLLQRLE